MSKQFNFKIIDKNTKDKIKVKLIYEEAFPAWERIFSFNQLLNFSKNFSDLRILGIYKNKILIGLIIFIERQEYVYLWYFAIKKEFRNKDYGSELIKNLIKKFYNKQIICRIETPLKETSNYNQRIRRENFYKQFGIKVTKYAHGINKNRALSIASNKFNNQTIIFFKDWLNILYKIFKKPKVDGMKFYFFNNGEMNEVSKIDWFSS